MTTYQEACHHHKKHDTCHAKKRDKRDKRNKHDKCETTTKSVIPPQKL